MGNIGTNIFTMSGEGAGNYMNAARLFDAILSIGATFSINMLIAYRNGNKGIDVYNTLSNTLFNFNVGSDKYFFGVPGNQIDLTLAPYNWQYSQQSVFTLSAFRVSGFTYNITISRSAPAQTTNTLTSSFTFGTAVAGFHTYVGDTDTGIPVADKQLNNLYFNNLRIL